jgi:hypothetical protein
MCPVEMQIGVWDEGTPFDDMMGSIAFQKYEVRFRKNPNSIF